MWDRLAHQRSINRAAHPPSPSFFSSPTLLGCVLETKGHYLLSFPGSFLAKSGFQWNTVCLEQGSWVSRCHRQLHAQSTCCGDRAPQSEGGSSIRGGLRLQVLPWSFSNLVSFTAHYLRPGNLKLGELEIANKPSAGNILQEKKKYWSNRCFYILLLSQAMWGNIGKYQKLPNWKAKRRLSKYSIFFNRKGLIFVFTTLWNIHISLHQFQYISASITRHRNPRMWILVGLLWFTYLEKKYLKT